ncbi:hypothetical protein ACIBKZ_09910 [Streptomyces sp. NPDC050421]|uniref:hypothetical protein n=1 Tax=Streptomyces sp. NPDC050421 TaxID=3365613 RepID=UPI0037B8E251
MKANREEQIQIKNGNDPANAHAGTPTRDIPEASGRRRSPFLTVHRKKYGVGG